MRISTGTSAMRKSVNRFGAADARTPRRATALTTEGDDTLTLAQIRQPVAQHPSEILARLRDRRDAAGLLHPSCPGVVRRDGEREIPAVPVEQHPEMATPALDVVARQED